ncbi:MAG: GNAT family N-acetyltransferase [Rhizobiaceae bacterium]
MHMEAPVIETARLRLRPHRVDDFEAYASMWSDPSVTRHIGGKPFSPEHSWSRLLRCRGMWAALGFGFWAVEDRSSGSLAGEVGFLELKRDVTPSIEGTLEAGWVFSPPYQGRGHATEAVATILGWASREHPGIPVTCMINPGNRASRRIADKFDFRAFADTTYQGNPVVLFRREPQDNPAARSTARA